jgi:hypothetical protein
MWEDPIVEEVHRIREKLAAEYNFDVKAIFADLRKRQAALGGRLVLQQRTADQRLPAIRPSDSQEEDSLIDELLRTDPKFQALVAKSKASPGKPFALGED